MKDLEEQRGEARDNFNSDHVIIDHEDVEASNPQENKEGANKDLLNSKISLQALWFELINIKTYFNWNDFFYTLLLGLAPSVWDIVTDFQLAKQLIHNGEVDTAGFCYVFICLPGFYLFPFYGMQLAFHKIYTLASCIPVILLIAFAIFLYLAVTLTVLSSPTSFFYVALPVASFTLITKCLAVVLHGPHMKKIAMMVSTAESSCESSCQLVLLFHLWFFGGVRYKICQ